MMNLVWAVTVTSLVALASGQTTSEQLPAYGNRTKGSPVPFLTTSAGCPVQFNDAITGLNQDILRNEYLIDSLTHSLNERIPERFVHAKGSGAFGYFKTTHNVTDLTKAKFLSEVGKITPVVSRFSLNIPRKGESDLNGNLIGFAVKFYTEEGNFDFAGMQTPAFPIRDPVKFTTLAHALKRNPATDLYDFNMAWDFIVKNPEVLFAFIIINSPYGIPNGYRHMLGHSIHTMQLANSKNETTFARFYFYPTLGLQNFTTGSSNDTDYFTRDLYDAIGNGSYPSWDMYVQPITLQQVLDARAQGVDVFDVTRTLSEKTYPLRPVGTLTLNRNPVNHFAEMEQLAFCPGNLVPGIVGAPDSLFLSRIFGYRQTQIHRLGINYNRITVNQPVSATNTINRDGVGPVLGNEGDAPNYYPNSFNGVVPVPQHQPPIYRFEEILTSNADLSAEFYQNLSETDKVALVTALVNTLSAVTKELVTKALELIASVDLDLHARITKMMSN